MIDMKSTGLANYTLKNDKENNMITATETKKSVEGRIVDIAVILNGPIDNALKDNITDLKNGKTVNVEIRTVMMSRFVSLKSNFSDQNEKEIAEEIKRQYEKGEWAVEVIEEDKRDIGEGIRYSLKFSLPKECKDD